MASFFIYFFAETLILKNFEKIERDYENSIAHRYDLDYHEPPIMRRHSADFVKYVASIYKEGDRVLDLGCASGSLWNYFFKYLKNPGALTGVDLSPNMIENAKRNFPSSDFRVGSMLSIPADSGSFDIVIVSSAFHHIPDKMLPKALKEIYRVLDEHGKLVGREPLLDGRVGDRGGWLAGALMNLRHMVYRLTHTREFPEPDPGPFHHAYVCKEFIALVNEVFKVTNVAFRNPVSPFFSRVYDPLVVELTAIIDEYISHKEGQELYYLAEKNYADFAEVQRNIRLALEENKIEDVVGFLAMVESCLILIDSKIGKK